MNPVVYLTQKLWKYAQGNRHNVVLYLVFFIIANGFHFLEPLVIAKMLNIIQEQGITTSSIATLVKYLALFFALTPGFWLFHGIARVVENKNAFIVRANYKKYLLNGVLAFPMEWHTDHHSGDTIDKVEKGTSALYRYSGDTFQLIETITSLISSLIALSYFNLNAGFIAACMVTLTILLILRFDEVLVGQYKTLYRAENKISEKVFDIISNITTVIILRIERLVSSALYKKIMEPLKLFMENNVVNEVKWFFVALSSTTMIVLVMGVYFYSNIGGGVLIGTVYALYGYVSRMSELFYRFAYMYSDIVQQKSAVMNAEEIANDFSKNKSSKSISLNAAWRELKINNLQFSYNTAEQARLHLNNISLVIRRGQKVAFIGASGSGKTTFLKVIRELYKPQRGEVYLDNKLLPGHFQSLSPDIALIPQDPEIFSTTISENITVGVNHSASHIKRFTDMACFTDVISRLPHGLESNIFEKGVNLSGGEKQRLALARGLMASEDKAMVLLDEATSSVDTKNELYIYENIFKAFKGKTIIASIHRLHLLSLFDEIYFFKAGKIVASGTLASLRQSSPEFQALWSKYNSIHLKVESSSA
ncbi:MAG: ABC transporter ATP-binding protein [Candidatus Abawacabacteria bacterium]|nr:ABC transporter ATP-binding protein [Candidatus Abawacabacteria bacterium]